MDSRATLERCIYYYNVIQNCRHISTQNGGMYSNCRIFINSRFCCSDVSSVLRLLACTCHMNQFASSAVQIFLRLDSPDHYSAKSFKIRGLSPNISATEIAPNSNTLADILLRLDECNENLTLFPLVLNADTNCNL